MDQMGQYHQLTIKIKNLFNLTKKEVVFKIIVF